MAATAWVRKMPAPIALTVALLLGCGFSVHALAASNPVVICDDTPQDMLGFGIPVENLSLKIVDHAAADAAADLNESLNLADAELQIVAPFLSLTPRAATLLDRIFATDSQQFDTATVESASPLAEQVTGHPEIQDDVKVTRSRLQQTTADEKRELPRIPQQMYRKDI